jgi:hypothetical protein
MAGSLNAACGLNQSPTYRDISVVRYGRTACFGKCSSYKVQFQASGECLYVGFKNVKMLGTYTAPCSQDVFERVISILKKNEFYALNFDSSVFVLDVPDYIVSARRCGVTMTLDWPAAGQRNDIIRLLKDLDDITGSLRWKYKAAGIQSIPLVSDKY